VAEALPLPPLIEVKGLCREFPAGDEMLTVLKDVDLTIYAGEMVAIVALTFRKLEVVPEALEKAFTPDIFATDAAYELVKNGQTFRDAYRQVGLHLEDLKGRDPHQTIADRTHTGAAGNLGLDGLRAELAAKRQAYAADRERVETALTALAGAEVLGASGL